ncbi:MAG: FAD-dependent oxidoreductase [Ferruginibacter sp.]|nr:FAD-dependent oxidoreductase [Cytophagales bacterium]
MEHHPVVIVGAGVAGLTCARYLQQFGIPSTVLEAGDGVGGRVRTDKAEGFQLDRGFQVFLTNYPEAKRLLDYPALQLRNFRSGAVIRDGAKVIELKNPLREPLASLSALTAPIGSLADKLRIVQLVRQVSSGEDEQLLSGPTTTTLEFLRQFGWSEKIIRVFFRPFFGGIFLERELDTASNFFQFVFKQFYAGDAALPAKGIGAIPEQIARGLPPDCVRSGVEVLRIAGETIYLPGGETLRPTVVVLAVDAGSVDPLMGQNRARSASENPPRFNRTTCTYFAAPQSPQKNRLLTLHTDNNSAVHNLCVPSDVAPGYAPDGQALISVSTHGPVIGTDQELAERIRTELTGWYGESVRQWRHLKTYRIPHALPQYRPEDTPLLSLKLNENTYRCGDYTRYPSLNAAMQSGRQVAEAINNDQ